MGVEHAIRQIKDGQRIRVNGTDGFVEILSGRGGSTATEREAITAQDAVAIVEGSAWGYVGGSFYDGVVQRREGPLTVF